MKILKILSLLISLFFSITCYAQYENIIVETKMPKDRYPIQFTLNKKIHTVCTGTSEYCPTRILISIDPNKEYVFNVYSFDGNGKFNESCQNKSIIVKNYGHKNILITRKKSQIICNIF